MYFLFDIRNSKFYPCILKGLLKSALTIVFHKTLIGTSTELNIKGIWEIAAFSQVKYFVCYKTSEALITEHVL